MAKKKKTLVCDYYKDWVKTYKEGTVRNVTLKKYQNTTKYLTEIAPNTTFKELDRAEYQRIINEFAKNHEKQTVTDFHHQLKAGLMDAIDEGFLKKDPTRKVIIKGKLPTPKKDKYLSLSEFEKLLNDLNLKTEVNFDYLILLVAKTGMRFSEAVAITPKDFDFKRKKLKINKTWDYKTKTGFVLTKNDSSNRVIDIDTKMCGQFETLCKKLEQDKPIFMQDEEPIYNATVNDVLERHCKKIDIPVISMHSLRHTHASVLLYKGVSVASISKRLGHANTTITEKVYLAIIDELKNKDKDVITNSLNEL